MELSEEDLFAMEARLVGLSPGPWISYVEGRDHMSGSSFIMVGLEDEPDIEMLGASVNDQDFIAAARQDVPRLIAEVRRLRALIGAA